MLMVLDPWLVKWPNHSGSSFCKRLASGARRPNHMQLMLMMLASWFVKWPQSLGQFVLQTSGASGAVRPKPYAADAHDARLLVRLNGPNHSGSSFCKRPGLRGTRGQNHTQLMLMMLASWFVKWPQSLGQFVLQTSGASGAARPKPYAADAHDARMAPITRAVRFANVRGFGSRAAKAIRS